MIARGAALAFAACLSACNAPSEETQACEGPAISSAALAARSVTMTSGPQGYLVVPNPIDATGNPNATVSSADTLSKALLLNLADLTSPSRLENSFLKIRIKTANDASSTLAAPTNGQFRFNLADVHYSEVMAYQSLQSMRKYLKALGFYLDESRSMVVTVRTEQAGVPADEVNAYYSHGYFDPTAPRTIKIFGNTSYAPGQDRLVYWHEFGHYVNESVSGQRGIDYAGDSGAVYTEASALHEALADYLAESVGETPNIGKWIAQNFEGYAPGQPLRSAVDSGNQRLTFSQVGLADGRGSKPERYAVAEWLTRVLWEIRTALVAESASKGPVKADMIMIGALSLLKKDASISSYRNAIIEADRMLYCGGHQGAIEEAFEGRGFVDGQRVASPLTMQATVYGLNSSGQTTTTVAPGQEFLFRIRISNPGTVTARNVRVRLESSDSRIYETTYEQGYGDVVGGRTLDIGGSGGLPFEHSVFGMVDRNAARGIRLPYKLRLISENANETVFNGEIQL